MATPQIVGIVLVRNEDVFVERAIRNIAAFCDRIHTVDHVSTDGTWEILCSLARELDHVHVRRIRHAGESHRLLEPYAGTDTWVFGVDGDELYDPHRLAGFRDDLRGGAFKDSFRVIGNVLNCVGLDRDARTATGYLSPPSRPVVKLFNFAAIHSWRGNGAERLHAGTIAFRDGFDGSTTSVGEGLTWDTSPLRCLHVCFLRRSSLDPQSNEPHARPNVVETGMQDRSVVGDLKRLIRRRRQPDTSDWKRDKYMRGGLTTVDATPFFPPVANTSS